MNEKIKQYQLRLFNKLFSTLYAVKKLNNLENDLNLKKPVELIYYSHNKDFWFSKGESKDKYVYIFGPKIKPIHEITSKDATLIIDFDKNTQYNDNNLGLFSTNNSELHVLINIDILNKQFPYLNTRNFKIIKFQSIDRKLKLNVIDLGNLNNDFLENLEELIIKTDNFNKNEKTQQITGIQDKETCEICSKKISDFKIDSRLNNLKNIRPELCGKCIEKIVVSEFYDTIKPYINGNDTRSLEIAKEKFGRYELFEYGIKLLEKYDILRYIGVKKQFFSIDTNPYLVTKFKKHSNPNNLLIDNIFQKNKKETKKKNNPIDIRDTTLTPETKNRMNLFINALKSGKSHDEAYKIAKLNNQKVENWYKFGKRGDFNYIPFYNEYKTLRPENIERNEKMDIFLNSLKNDNDIENALKESNLTHVKVRAWYSLGEKGSEEFRDFYLACKILLPDGIPKRETKKIVDNEALMNEFIALIEAGKSNEEAIKQLKIPKFKVKNWVNQGKLGNKKYIGFYNTYMIEIKKEREIKKAKKRAQKILKQKEKEEKLKNILEETEEPSSAKKCEICGRTLNKQSKNIICKRCARKQYAAKILIRLLKSINPEIPFKKDDLKILGLESFQVQDYIWTLQEFNLITKEQNKFKLKDKKILDDFIESSGLNINEIETDETKVKLNKTCKKCGETLEISKFFPSKTTEDGFEDNCKDCKKLIITAGYLKEILEFVDYESKFSEEDLRLYFHDSFKLQAKIWSLLDNDLAMRNFETNDYTLTDRKTCEDFLDKYYEEKAEKSNQTSTTRKDPKEYTKEYQMKIVIKAISEGKSRKEAADEANIPLYKINHWYREGQQGYGNENNNFYKQIKELEEINERKNKDLKNKMEKVLNGLRNGKNLSQITITNKSEINDWIEKGKQNKEPYNGFYEKYMELKNNIEKHEIPQIKKSDQFGTSLSITQMNVILEKLANGMDEKKAVNEANISFNTYKYWLNRGKKGFGEVYTEFYNYVIQIKNGNYSSIEQPQVTEDDSNSGNIPSEIDPDIYAPLSEENEKTFKGRTTKTGIAWVNNVGDKWVYSTTIKRQPIRINSESIYELHSKVKNKNYPWGIRDYEKAKEIINIPDDFEIPKPTPDEIEITDIDYSGIYQPLPKEYEKSFKSTKTNKTGIAWVNKIGNRWIYSRSINGKQIDISSNNIYGLYEKVTESNLIWGIRDYEKAKEIINIPDDFEIPKPTPDEIEITDIDYSGIYQPLPKEYEKSFKSTKTNKTGIAWVNKIGNRWIYSRSINGKQIDIYDNNIYGLYEKVTGNNLIWGIRDYEKAKEIINMEDEYEIPNDKNLNTDIYAPLSKKDISKFNPNPNNKTGIAWVNQYGLNWVYQRQKDGKIIKLQDPDIHKLHEKVIKNNQVWGIIDFEKATKIIEPHTIGDGEYTQNTVDSKVSVTYIEKPTNETEILIKGIIKNNELIKILNNLDLFEKNIKKIISTSINDDVDIFIELEINKYLIPSFKDRIKEFKWKINK